MRHHVITEGNADYHARESISASRLKLLRESPRKYQAKVLLGGMKTDESRAMKIGSAVHAKILEPESFADRYVLKPEECSDRRTRAYKEWAPTAGDRVQLSVDEWSEVHCCCTALLSHPIAGQIIRAAEMTEGVILYKDVLTGADCRVRFDGASRPIVWDIKTIRECTDEEIRRTFTDKKAGCGYHVQSDHYLEGFTTLDPSTPWQFAFLYVETCEPWRVRVINPAECKAGESVTWADVGKVERAALIRDLLARNASGDWSEPGENEVCSVSVPTYYKGLN